MGSVAYTGAGSGGHPFGGPSMQGAANITSFGTSNSIRNEQIIVGKVVSVNLGKDKPEQIGEVMVQRITAWNDTSFNGSIYCLPINSNIHIYPVIGELVPIILLDGQHYYLYPLNLFNLTNNNAVLVASDSIDNSNADTVNSGIPSTIKTDELKIGDKVSEQSTIIPRLYPLEGDIMFEGRFGNCIRIGYNNNAIENYPNIKQSLINSPDGLNKTGYENLDTDSCIWMVSDEELVFKSTDIVIDSRTGVPQKMDGTQTIISSGRIIFNAKQNEILLFSKNGIHNASDSNFSVDSGKSIFINSQGNTEITSIGGDIILRSAGRTIIQSPYVFLGDSAPSANPEPIVKGMKLYEFLNKLINALLNQKYQTGAGTSGPPLNSTEIALLKSELASLLSNRSFTA